MTKKGSLFLVLLSLLTVFALPGISYSQSALDGFNPNANGIVWSIAVQEDGKILLGGIFTKIGADWRYWIARLNPDGSLDSGFNADLSYAGVVRSIAIQADGKILIGGDFTTIGGETRPYIARLNSDGTLDDGFIDPNVNNSVYAIAVQADGKILIGGIFTKIGVEDRKYIARLNPDGSLDTGFINPGANYNVYSIAVQADEKILIGGGFSSIGGEPRKNIARLNPDGTLDDSFIDPNADGRILSIAVQPDEKILIGGFFTTIGGGPPYVARLNPNGSLDTDFNPDANGRVYSVALQADGKILVGGEFTNIATVERNYIARLNPNGSLDTGFNPNANSNVWSIAVQADGKILIGGEFTAIGAPPGTPRNNFARLYPDGSLDKDLDPNGNAGWGSGWGIQCIGLQADGKILVGGEFTTIGGTPRNNIARLHPDGSLDEGFDPNANGLVRSIAVQADGKILIGGIFTTIGTPGITRNLIARLNSNGTLDDSFDAGAFGGGSDEWIFSISVQPDGKILVGGIFATIGGEPRNNIARLNPDGGLDTGFDPNAKNFPNNLVRSFALQADGKIIVVGEFTAIGETTMNHIARLNSDGTLDESFIDPQVARGGLWCSVYSIVIQADEKILVGGYFSSIGGTTRNNIARLNKEGTLDTSFNPNANWTADSIVVQTDGKILIVGGFTTIGISPVTRNRIARLNPDGSVDTTFNPDADGGVLTTTIQADGKILVGGQFTDIGGVTRMGIARLTNTDAAIQELVVSSDGSSVTWMRGQASPEVWRVTFEHSYDGVTWGPLGNGSRISGGWQLTGLSLPVSQNHYVRARGYGTGGSQNVSGMVFESVRSLTVSPSALVPVVSSFKINAGAASTAKGTATLNNVATKKPSHYMASELPNFDDASWQPYSTAPIFNLSTGKGTKIVYLVVRNSSGESARVSDSIEALGPAVTSFKINGGALSTQNQLVTLNNTATNLPLHYMASESDTFAGAIWLQYSTAPSFALGPGGKKKTVYFKVKNWFDESPKPDKSYTIDVPIPTVTSFKINGGAATTTKGLVTLNNTATNLPLHYMASEREDFANTWWQLYSTAPKFTLSAGSGKKTVYFKVRNSFSESPEPTKSATIKALAPAVTSFNINAGATNTANSVVTLNNTATNSPTHYKAASTSGDLAGASWLPYSTVPKFVLSDGGVGLRTIYFKVKNSIDESSEAQDEISASGSAPVLTSFKINAGALKTANGTVTLSNTATNAPTHYMASEDSGFSGANWMTYSAAPRFTLSAGSGMKKVYFKAKNIFGPSADKSYAIEALAPAVTSFKINAGAASTANGVVTLNNVATNSPTHYMASEDSGFSGASWLPYSSAPKFTLSPGDGPKTVYFKVRNSVAESPEPARSDAIEALAPVVTSFKINGGAASTANGNVTLNNTATNGPTHYMASVFSHFSGADWQIYSKAPKFTLFYGAGTKTLYFKVKNGFAESNVMNDTIVADGLAPVVTSFKINAGAGTTANRKVTLNNTSINLPMYYMASELPSFADVGWQPYSTAPQFTLSADSGTKTVYFKTENIFGESSVMSDTIETLAPAVTLFKINTGAVSTANGVVTLNNVATNSPTHYKASEDQYFTGAEWQIYSTAPKLTLSDGSGEKRIYFMVKNSFSESEVISDTILASGLPPVVISFKINGGAASTMNALVTLNNTAMNFPMYYMASENPGFTGANWQLCSTAPKFQLFLGWVSGARTVYFKTRNIFGESSVVSDTISSPMDVIWD